jgi:hypothetical protein
MASHHATASAKSNATAAASHRWRRPSSRILLHGAGMRPYSGMFPCFFAGFSCRFVFSMSKARITLGRVSSGRITSST